ncbi:16S rRNA (cytosine(967)-C(5))-methyltransferase [Sporosarcina sp. P37]|uniref:16S rRNA (cytosine(967)-C(5))-methyltransferase RsmB n=1 Tax=unclassified Sporosarcina TaxID=2647733 RepID=UPI000A17B1C6|nr:MULTISPECIES: 16S rRNA (cytosine(967)-C(5))-methyltransferase RsmB [unclassified Sporosarcina]ARK25727.1 16S rRNA (cytosine(967)-C(5))-methyltransferase [Sporosarcina sp. P37]PID19251.1 16S rRNA (cytosine(967)-C(5))-methyltransferase RsmB [Sporosarcina sp. P35]
MTNYKKKIWRGNVRDAALSILMEIENEQAFSNLLLHKTIELYDLPPKDRALLTELTYGTLQQQMTLDYYLAPFVRGKLQPWVRQLLRLSVYQIIYLSKIPEHAVVNEAVKIANKRGHKGVSSMVNGILRSILREGVPSLDEIEDPVTRLSIETSHPEWLIRRWIEQYGMEEATAAAVVNNQPPITTARINKTKTNKGEVIGLLKKEGIIATPGTLSDSSIQVESGNIASTEVFKQGLLTIQDESSMLPAIALQVEPGMRVLDMCAAPGGKTTHIAERMNDEGEIQAHDLHPHKLRLIEQNAQRLGLNSIHTNSGDSRALLDTYEARSFDRVLVDAPCSGLGVIRRKPEIKYKKTLQDIQNLSVIQKELLQVASRLVKIDGLLVYSTCTIDKSENEEIVDWFLREQPDFKLVPLHILEEENEQGYLQILPHDHQSDGFFIAAMQRIS